MYSINIFSSPLKWTLLKMFLLIFYFLYFPRNYSLNFQTRIRDVSFALKLCSSHCFQHFSLSGTRSILRNIHDFFFSWELKLMGKCFLLSHLNHIKVRFFKDFDILFSGRHHVFMIFSCTWKSLVPLLFLLEELSFLVLTLHYVNAPSNLHFFHL